MRPERIATLKDVPYLKGDIVYWMSRDCRVSDNWALIAAAEMAKEKGVGLYVVYCLAPSFLEATIRHYGFLMDGLMEVEERLKTKDIGFALLSGYADRVLPKWLLKMKAGALFTDFDPLSIKKRWKDKIARNINIPFFEVDARNIVPARFVSDKKEWAARTLRPKLKKLLPGFLEEFPSLPSGLPETDLPATKWAKAESSLEVDFEIREVKWLRPGERAGKRMLNKFIDEKLPRYSEMRNDPNEDVLSDLSPYLHFGMISAARVAMEVKDSSAPEEDKKAFLEELITRRELADNFCLYEPLYDSFEGLPEWGRKTLRSHKRDKREYVYSSRKLESGKTHDPLWNAAQNQMVVTGKMHGYMRMYWAKKILEWSRTPEEAIRTAIRLNDRYELDGRDPNGYAGIAWAIGGLHDRPWPERKIFGKVRYMSAGGAASKFDTDAYIKKFQ